MCDRFIEHFFASDAARSYFRKAAQGIAGSMPKISQPTIEALSVPLPGLADQERIAARIDERLSDADAVLTTSSVSLSRASRLRAAVLKAAFAGQLATASYPPAISKEA